MKRSDRDIDQTALQLVASVQGLLVLAKSGLSDADIKTARTAIVAAII
jgi:TetR/AcrR family transcriptional repressor of nem operon